ncbi:hypothetical protein EDD11_009804 [Mortierella claussenii]|nr:hypothetical protein EDD11_009804 [Mortierella claussenii]
MAIMRTILHQHKPMYHSRGSTAAASVSLAGFDASLMKTLSNSVDQQHCSNNASKGEPSSEMKDCEQPCVIRKNKALPPPTLSHILPMTISNPALLSPTRATNPLSPSGSSDRPSDASSSLSWSSSEEDDNDSDGGSSHAWPKMDKFFFPDHCCRTSACPPCSTRQPAGNKKGAGNNSIHNKPQAKNKKPFMSELPPPPTSATAQKDTEGCIALSTSIWGVGWRQVEPLPESFVKMVQKSNLMWAGCERERPNGRHRHRRDSGHGHGYHQHSNHAGNRNRVIKTQQGGPRKAASDVSSSASWATDCSCRLPRSLQFVD